MRHTCNCNRDNYVDVYPNEGGLNDQYMDLLNVLSTALQIYNVDQGNKQDKSLSYLLDTQDKILDKLECLEAKTSRLERMLERSLYND